MHAGRERCAVSSAKPRPHFRSNRPRSGNNPPALCHAGEESLPAFCCLMGEDDRTYPVFPRYPAALAKCTSHALFEERTVLQPAAHEFGLVLHYLGGLRGQIVAEIQRIAR